MKNKTKEKLSLKQLPFHKLVVEDQELATIRKDHSKQSPEDRRMAAQFVYDSGFASTIFNRALPEEYQENRNEDDPAVVAYAIDPLFAPACLTVAGAEYLQGWKLEAIENMNKLPNMPDPDEDLPIIISKAVDFLIDNEEFQYSMDLLAKTLERFPQDADFYDSMGYVKFRLGDKDDAIVHFRKAVELEPKNPTLLSNFGWFLMETQTFAEAESVLNKALEIDPDHKWANGNLEQLREIILIEQEA